MLSQRFKLTRTALCLISLSPTLLLSACGGGTAGTGNGHSRFLSGRILGPSGAPVAEADVEVIETGDKTRTDQAGSFSLRSRLPGPSINFEVKTSYNSTPITTKLRTDAPSKIGIELILEENASEIVEYVDASLIPSSDCKGVFIEDADLLQSAPLTSKCSVTASALQSVSSAPAYSFTLRAVSCPNSIPCPKPIERVKSEEVSFEITPDEGGNICKFTIDYRSNSGEILQSLTVEPLNSSNSAC